MSTPSSSKKRHRSSGHYSSHRSMRVSPDGPQSCPLTHPACQQDLRACEPSFESRPQITFLVGAAIHLLVAVVVFYCGRQARVWSYRYDQNCSTHGVIKNLTFQLDDRESERLFFYYELTGFQQNHFRFAGSYSVAQMTGQYDDDLSGCSPYASDPDSKAELFPCGLLPNYVFNDHYNFSDPRFRDTGITWANELNNTFKPPNAKYNAANRTLLSKFMENETLDEHFVVWMRIAKASTFRKLWAKVVDARDLRSVVVTPICNFPLSVFSGERRIVLVRPGGLGGHNYFLAGANFGMAVICGLAGGWFACRLRRRAAAKLPEFSDDVPASRLGAL